MATGHPPVHSSTKGFTRRHRLLYPTQYMLDHESETPDWLLQSAAGTPRACAVHLFYHGQRNARNAQALQDPGGGCSAFASAHGMDTGATIGAIPRRNAWCDGCSRVLTLVACEFTKTQRIRWVVYVMQITSMSRSIRSSCVLLSMFEPSSASVQRSIHRSTSAMKTESNIAATNVKMYTCMRPQLHEHP